MTKVLQGIFGNICLHFEIIQDFFTGDLVIVSVEIIGLRY